MGTLNDMKKFVTMLLQARLPGLNKQNSRAAVF